jgi:hypothetical protein
VQTDDYLRLVRAGCETPVAQGRVMAVGHLIGFAKTTARERDMVGAVSLSGTRHHPMLAVGNRKVVFRRPHPASSSLHPIPMFRHSHRSPTAAGVKIAQILSYGYPLRRR